MIKLRKSNQILRYSHGSRLIIFILICLVFGAAMSVAVAWWATLREWEDTETLAVVKNGWKAGMKSTSTRTVIHAINVEAHDQWLAFHTSTMELDLSNTTVSPLWFSLSTKPANEKSQIRGIGAGWPLTCVFYIQEHKGDSVFLEWDFAKSGGIIGTNPFDNDAEYSWGRNYLPLRVIPLGLFVDALTYGTCLVFIVLVVRFILRLRAKRNQRRKRCPYCKYDLSRTTSKLCSECGADPQILMSIVTRNTIVLLGVSTIIILIAVVGFGLAFRAQFPFSQFHYAAYHGDINTVRRELVAGIDVDAEASANNWLGSNDYYTPLALAAYRGHIEIVKLLLEAGADLEVKNSFGFTAIHLSIAGGSKECVAMLLNAGADVNARSDAMGYFIADAISQTANAPEYDQEMLDMILDAGYLIDPHSKQTDVAFRFALYKGNDQFVHRLLDLGGVPGYLALSYSVKTGRLDWLKIFETQGSDFSDVSRFGRPLLHSVNGDYRPIEVIEFLLKRGEPIDGRDKFGTTALIRASESNDIELSRILLDFDAEPNLRNNQGMSAIDMAVEAGWDQLVQVFLDAGAEVKLVDDKGMRRFADLEPELEKLLQEKATSNSKEKQPDE